MHFHNGDFHPGRWVAVLLAIALAFAAPRLRAAGLEEALAHFATDDYGEIEAGITAGVGSGGPPAAPDPQGGAGGRPPFHPRPEPGVFKEQVWRAVRAP